MNIFYLDSDPVVAAQMLCNRHVVKMGLESVQMLGCLLPQDMAPYKHTHRNHPSTVWALTSDENYLWLVRHAEAIFAEYTKRYGKIHKSELALIKIKAIVNALVDSGAFHRMFPRIGLTPMPQCMPDDCKVLADSVAAYRKYYKKHKASFAIWPENQTPTWWTTA